MLLRGMHDTGCDDIYIIVTDLKRQEMDDATAYLQLSTQYAVSGRRKTDIEQQMQYECTCYSAPSPRVFVLPGYHRLSIPNSNRPFFCRYVLEKRHSETKSTPLFPPNRPNHPRNPLRKTPTLRYPLLPSNIVLLADIFHASRICPGPRDLLRLPHRVSKSVLYRGLRNGQVSQEGS